MWHPNGQLHAQGLYHANREEGFWVYYSDNGHKVAEGGYVVGRREGMWTTWFDDGMKESEGNYLAGVKSGNWSFWNLLSGESDRDKSGYYSEGKRQ